MRSSLKSKYSQNEFNIRRIKKSDNLALTKIIKRVLNEYGLIHTSLRDPELENIYLAYSKNKCAYFVIVRETDNKILGGAGVSCVMENSVCELKKMYLLPEGRGLGLGQVLLDKVLSYAKKKGYKQCYLENLDRMDKTSHLHKKTGFIWLDKPIEEISSYDCRYK